MQIYLWDKESDNLKLYNSEKHDIKKELKKRKITISESATIGDYVTIGYSVTIGSRAKIRNKPLIFSELNILNITSILMQNNEGVFYKAVREDLKDFYSGKYQYVIGGNDKMKLKRDQNIDCGAGTHWTSYWGAIKNLDNRKGKIISAKIKLKDVLSVSAKYSKIRVKAYSDVKEVKIAGLKVGK